MKRGEIWWAVLPKPAGRRPVVLLSRDEAYQVRNLVTVAPVTTTIRDIPVEVRLGREDGLPRDCAVNLDTVTTIPKSSLQQMVSFLGAEKLHAVNQALKFALDLD
ncbi:MAG: type II toxin-antitoxin system PemK/MazF family toxin [Deltaproteobacteria bacterium]|nr:type II toxin-antitoxin system PemK/MazF family toxin [Deltaproteobacteria bacterium]